MYAWHFGTAVNLMSIGLVLVILNVHWVFMGAQLTLFVAVQLP
jgi:hypothetical protein